MTGLEFSRLFSRHYFESWQKIPSRIPQPKSILVISAHWFTRGSFVNNNSSPETIHDFYGFPSEMYDYHYPSLGSPELANRVLSLLGNDISIEKNYGVDHGAWCVLRGMYPEGNIPFTQLSVDGNASPSQIFEIGKKLKVLRSEGVLILGSGNITHNLREMEWGSDKPYPWAQQFDTFVSDKIMTGHFKSVLDYPNLDHTAKLAVPSTDHFYPLLYILGAANNTEKVELFNQRYPNRSLSMTSFLIG